jgi:hypothetical protein
VSATWYFVREFRATRVANPFMRDVFQRRRVDGRIMARRRRPRIAVDVAKIGKIGEYPLMQD